MTGPQPPLPMPPTAVMRSEKTSGCSAQIFFPLLALSQATSQCHVCCSSSCPVLHVAWDPTCIFLHIGGVPNLSLRPYGPSCSNSDTTQNRLCWEQQPTRRTCWDKPAGRDARVLHDRKRSAGEMKGVHDLLTKKSKSPKERKHRSIFLPSPSAARQKRKHVLAFSLGAPTCSSRSSTLTVFVITCACSSKWT